MVRETVEQSHVAPEKRLEALALLKILELGEREIEAGQVQPAADVIARLRKRHQTD